MIKAGTRVSNHKGTGGFEFTKDYSYDSIGNLHESYKAYGKQRKPAKGGKLPLWFAEWVMNEINFSENSRASEINPTSDYAWSEHVIPVVYTYKTDDRVYSIEDDENLYHVQLATLSDGEYFMRKILTTRWLWIARAYVRLHGWLR